jgi:hypothetical protein
MDLLLAMLVFLGLTGVFALLGLNVWVWPKAAIDRVTASAADPQAQEVAHPSLAFRDLLKKLGTLVPASPKDTTIMQRRLIRAGFRNPNALKVLYGAKFVLALLIPVLTFGVIAGSSWESSSKIMATLAVRSRSAGRCRTRSTFWWFRSSRDWGWTRRSCRSPRSWRTPIRRSPRNSR